MCPSGLAATPQVLSPVWDHLNSSKEQPSFVPDNALTGQTAQYAERHVFMQSSWQYVHTAVHNMKKLPYLHEAALFGIKDKDVRAQILLGFALQLELAPGYYCQPPV